MQIISLTNRYIVLSMSENSVEIVFHTFFKLKVTSLIGTQEPADFHFTYTWQDEEKEANFLSLTINPISN